MKEVAIGIDMGGTNTRFGIVDKQGKILAEDAILTGDHKSLDDFLSVLYDKMNKTLESCNGEVELQGIGVGAPNGNYYKGTIEHAPNLIWKGIIPFVDHFKKFVKAYPVTLTNDANAAAIGEKKYGGGKKMQNFVSITLGTGLGGGIILDGHLLYGNDGFAGEIGHINVIKDGRQCGCGKRGCLETYASANGLKRTVFELLADETYDSELRVIPFDQLTSKQVAQAAERGDKLAIKAFEITGEILGRKLADVVAITNIEAIFLFGGLINSGEFLMKPTRKHFEINLLNVNKGKVKLLVSELQNENIAILGASALVWEELSENKPAEA